MIEAVFEDLSLKEQIAEAQEGKRFFLQGGDCAENFNEVCSPLITNRLKVLLQMSLALVHGLQMPVVGVLLRKVAVAKFTRTLSTMLQSGVPILEALQVVARTAGNRIIERAVFRVGDSIAEGRPIAEPLEESGVFPNMVVQMINVGESVGALDTMLEKIADFYDEEVDQAVDNLTAMIEPFMMVFLGGMIGGLVVAMYLPIFKIASVV